MLIRPVGRCRMEVRGFNASNFRSTIRLNAIAHVRAQTMAVTMSASFGHPGQPRFSRAATAIAARAKGMAKRVWENLMKAAQFLMAENMQKETLNNQHRTSNIE